MNILALESSSTICGVAIFLNNKFIDIDELNKPRIHGEYLPLMVRNILKKNKLKVKHLDGIAVSEGPGSYTGLRIGMSLAKGLGIPFGIPIIPVPTLQALNKGVSRKGIYWILLHSHKNIVYAQCFDSGKVISEIECNEFDYNKYENFIGFNLDKIDMIQKFDLVVPTAKFVGELALENFNLWVRKDIDNVTPNYVTSIL